MAFKAFTQSRQLLGQFDTLSAAFKVKPWIVIDGDKLEYFNDGTGTGFSSFKQSNEGMSLAGHGIYNQKRRSIEQIKAVSWHIYWATKSIIQVRRYHNRVRQFIKLGKLEVTK